MLFVVQTPEDDCNIMGVFSNFEDAKNLAQSITNEINELTVIYKFDLNVPDKRYVNDKIIYQCEPETEVGPGGLIVLKHK